LRRIARRMQVNSVEDLPAYLAFMRINAGESAALLKDLLISVTKFFRDNDAYDGLGRHITTLIYDC
jgi:two-component system CheB/CheR fusion protein